MESPVDSAFDLFSPAIVVVVFSVNVATVNSLDYSEIFAHAAADFAE